MVKRAYINKKPAPNLPANAPIDAVKVEFANRLQAAMDKKGWRQSDLARHASLQLPSDKAIGRDSICGYVRAGSLPGPVNLNAIARALGCKPEDLLPARGIPFAGQHSPSMDAQDMGDGNTWLRINRAVPWDVALEIMNLIQRPVKT